jgi:hypothetical protein
MVTTTDDADRWTGWPVLDELVITGNDDEMTPPPCPTWC